MLSVISTSTAILSHIHMYISASISFPYLDLYLAHGPNIVNLPFSHMMPSLGILYLIGASAHLLSANDVIIQILLQPSFPLIVQLLPS